MYNVFFPWRIGSEIQGLFILPFSFSLAAYKTQRIVRPFCFVHTTDAADARGGYFCYLVEMQRSYFLPCYLMLTTHCNYCTRTLLQPNTHRHHRHRECEENETLLPNLYSRDRRQPSPYGAIYSCLRRTETFPRG